MPPPPPPLILPLLTFVWREIKRGGGVEVRTTPVQSSQERMENRGSSWFYPAEAPAGPPPQPPGLVQTDVQKVSAVSLLQLVNKCPLPALGPTGSSGTKSVRPSEEQNKLLPGLPLQRRIKAPRGVGGGGQETRKTAGDE